MQEHFFVGKFMHLVQVTEGAQNNSKKSFKVFELEILYSICDILGTEINIFFITQDLLMFFLNS